MFSDSLMFKPPSLESLPYDLVLVISSFLDLKDVHALHLTCRTLYSLTSTRPIYRHFASALLDRCRPLPLKGFTPLNDLSLVQLRKSVNQATKWEQGWRSRAPRPIPRSGFLPTKEPYENEHSNYMDNYFPKPHEPHWYRVIDSPAGEEIDWLSPITSCFVLSSTKSGKVILSSLINNDPIGQPLATFSPPGHKWELWKCRVEFEERAVYFCMAHDEKAPGDAGGEGNRMMEFILVKLSFRTDVGFAPSSTSTGPPGVSQDDCAMDVSPEPSHPNTGRSSPQPLHVPSVAHFKQLAAFKTYGIVMNVFLLDPLQRLLSAFVWSSSTNTIALYVLLDWDKDEYVFVDTGIHCRGSSNWSCILAIWPGPEPYVPPGNKAWQSVSSPVGPEQCIVLHSEEGDKAVQHFYPLSLLEQHLQRNTVSSPTPLHKRGLAYDREGRSRAFPTRTTFQDPLNSKSGMPKLSGSLIAPKIMERAFDFPDIIGEETPSQHASSSNAGMDNEMSPTADFDLDDGPTVGEGTVYRTSSTRLSRRMAEDTLDEVSPGTPGFGLGTSSAQNEPSELVHFGSPALAAVASHTAPVASSTIAAPSQATEDSSEVDSVTPNLNPFPHLPWYPESAHFVRQWWPSFPGHHKPQTPRVSCTVVLMAMHDMVEHRTRYILSQHYFSVPMFDSLNPPPFCAIQNEDDAPSTTKGKQKAKSRDHTPDCTNESGEKVNWLDRQFLSPWYAATPFEVVCAIEGEDEEAPGDGGGGGGGGDDEGSVNEDDGQPDANQQQQPGVILIDEDDNGGRPRPLIAVDFGHAIWVEYVENEDDDDEGLADRRKEKLRQRELKEVPYGTAFQMLEEKYRHEPLEDVDQAEVEYVGERRVSLSREEQRKRRVQKEADQQEKDYDANLKWLRFVTFPPFDPSGVVLKEPSNRKNRQTLGGKVRTLIIPDELNLDNVETINIDQSQGAVILSVRETPHTNTMPHTQNAVPSPPESKGQIFVLCYE